MSLLGNIMNKIFHHRSADAGTGKAGQARADHSQVGQPQGGRTARAPQQQPQQTATPAPRQNVDVGAVLSEMASTKAGGGNYKTSIVDLLKLLDLEPSLSARKELGQELGIHSGEDGSAEQNIALHKAVMDKLAANGGVVPDDMRN
jgi:hypothetical protein